jgi:hypothetical protein
LLVTITFHHKTKESNTEEQYTPNSLFFPHPYKNMNEGVLSEFLDLCVFIGSNTEMIIAKPKLSADERWSIC